MRKLLKTFAIGFLSLFATLGVTACEFDTEGTTTATTTTAKPTTTTAPQDDKCSISLINPYSSSDVDVEIFWYTMTDLDEHEVNIRKKYDKGIILGISIDNNLEKPIKVSAIIDDEVVNYKIINAGVWEDMTNTELAGNITFKLEDATEEDLKSKLTIQIDESADTETLKNVVHVYDNATNTELDDEAKVSIGQVLKIVVDNRASDVHLETRNDADTETTATLDYTMLTGTATNDPILITVAGDVIVDLEVKKPDRTITVVNISGVTVELFYIDYDADDNPVEIEILNNSKVANHTEICGRVTNTTGTNYVLVSYRDGVDEDETREIPSSKITEFDGIFADYDLTIKIELPSA